MTVTDAHVWLGRLPADAFLGGERPLDRDAVEPRLAALAREVGGGLEETAEGVLSVADSAMERALRVISVERGYDPAELALVTFGGAGGLHAAELVRRLGAERAVVPPDPGLLSAFGMLAAPVTREASRTVLMATDEGDTPDRMDGIFADLERDAVEAMLSEGRSREELSVRRRVEARYRGQSFELRVPADGWVDAFHRIHRERYGYDRRESPVEAVTLRVVVTAPGPPLETERLEAGEGPPPVGATRAFVDGGWREAGRVRRRDLRSGHRVQGPAAVTEYSSTTWVPADWCLEVDAWGCLHLLPGS